MRPQLLLTTTALALALGVVSVQAQSRRDSDGMQNAPSSPAMQGAGQGRSMPARSGSPREETTGQSRPMNSEQPGAQDMDRNGGGAQTERDRGQASPSDATQDRGRTSGEGNAAAEQKENNKPSSAQSEDHRPPSKSATEQEKGERGAARGERNRDETEDHRRAEQPRQGERNATHSRENNEAERKGSTRENNRAAERSNGERSGAKSERSAERSSRHTERLSASLKSSQKTRLAGAVSKIDVKPVSNVNFSVSVGTVVPRTVVLHPVPEAIVDIIPEYRDYEFFVVRDEIVIVEPRSHRIVDVIERSGPARAEVTTTTTKRKVRLSDKQREIIRRDISRGHVTTGAGTRTRIVVGEELPDSVEIRSFPEEIYEEVPTIRSYRYIESGPNVYLVDPDSRRVIEEIE